MIPPAAGQANLHRYFPVLMTLGGGLALSLLLFVMVGRWQQGSLRTEFREEASNRVDALEQHILGSGEILYSLRNFYASSHEVERGEFQTFVQDTLVRHPEIQSLLWLPQVSDAERAAYEQAAQTDVSPSFQFTELGPLGELLKAVSRPWYFPTYYVEPFEKNRVVFGFNHASSPSRLVAMEQARDQGVPIATEWVELLIDPHPSGFLVYLPIYRNGTSTNTLEDRRRNLTGFVAAAFRVDELLQLALEPIQATALEFSLSETSDSASGREVFSRGAEGMRKTVITAGDFSARRRQGMEWDTTFKVWGRTWSVACRSTPAFDAAHRKPDHWIVLWLSLFITVVITCYMVAVIDRALKIERVVARRTLELTEANARLTEEVKEREEAEGRREQSEHLYTDLIEGAPDPILILNPLGQLQSLNPAAETLSGYRSEELLGKHFVETGVVASASVPRTLKEFALLIAGSDRPPFEVEMIRKDGFPLIVEANPRSIRQEGKVVGIQLIFRDMTERKRLEQGWQEQAGALEQANEELAKREKVMRNLLEDIQVSKAQLEESGKQLRASNKQLEALSALKDEFVAKVSHELRTPLTSIKEGLSLLLDNALGKTTTEQQDFIKTMDTDVDRLTEMIGNMLDISKIEAGRLRLARSRIRIEALLRSIVCSYQLLVGQRTVTIECEGELSPVFIDRNRTIQIFTNLLSNAIKFTPDHEGRVVFRVSQQDSLVSVAVEDNGPGIAPDDLPKLFQKFAQVGAQPVQIRGTGLGLVVCKELAELHGGRIDVASTVGKGTTFTVWLPAYSDSFALSESVREMVEMIPASSEGQTLRLITIQAERLLEGATEAEMRRQILERLTERVRGHLHRGDVVLVLEPSWVVVLALAESDGIPAMVKRLREQLAEGAHLHFGWATYPSDGTQPAVLFQRAMARLGQEFRISEQPAPTPGASVGQVG